MLKVSAKLTSVCIALLLAGTSGVVVAQNADKLFVKSDQSTTSLIIQGEGGAKLPRSSAIPDTVSGGSNECNWVVEENNKPILERCAINADSTQAKTRTASTFDISYPISCPFSTQRHVAWLFSTYTNGLGASNNVPYEFWNLTIDSDSLPAGQIVSGRWHMLAQPRASIGNTHINVMVYGINPYNYIWMVGPHSVYPTGYPNVPWTDQNIAQVTELYKDLDGQSVQKWNDGKSAAAALAGMGQHFFTLQFVSSGGFANHVAGATVELCIRPKIPTNKKPPRSRGQ